MESEKNELIEAESRIVVVRGRGWNKWGDVGKRVQAFSYAG